MTEVGAVKDSTGSLPFLSRRMFYILQSNAGKIKSIQNYGNIGDGACAR